MKAFYLSEESNLVSTRIFSRRRLTVQTGIKSSNDIRNIRAFLVEETMHTGSSSNTEVVSGHFIHGGNLIITGLVFGINDGAASVPASIGFV